MTNERLTYEEFRQAADFVSRRTDLKPQVGMILGSGLNPLAEEVENSVNISYHEIPHFPIPSVEGHTGHLLIGRLAGRDVLLAQGRVHYYEGYSMQRITLMVRVMQLLGVHTLFVTNAAGGLNPDFRAGDLMLITDHISFAGMSGLNPLHGPNLDEFGPRFPDMSHAYDPALLQVARNVAHRLDIKLQEGVYVFLAGPSFETPAEIRFLRTIGADAVGMSTVPEVIVARHCGIRVMGISGISNVAIAQTESDGETTHQEVLEAGKVIVPRLIDLIKGVLHELPPV